MILTLGWVANDRVVITPLKKGVYLDRMLEDINIIRLPVVRHGHSC